MPRREERIRKLVNERQAEMVEELAAAFAGEYPDGEAADRISADPRELAKLAVTSPLVAAAARAAVTADADEDCAKRLEQATLTVEDLSERLEAATRMIDRQARGLQAERSTRIDASEPAAQLEAIAGMLYARVPHVMHGREHLPIGTIVLEVLDHRLPGRDPRGMMAQNGWPGRRRGPKREGAS